jgi:hypothetical protein
MAISSENPAIYVCKNFPGFTIREENTTFRFVAGKLTLTTEEAAALLDKVLAQNAEIACQIKKVDKQAAEAFVREHRNSPAFLASTAGKGGLTSAHVTHAKNSLQQRDADLAQMPMDQQLELHKQLAADSLLLTESTEPAPLLAKKARA